MKKIETYSIEVQDEVNIPPTRARAEVYERENGELMVVVDELPHDGNALGPEMEMALIEQISETHGQDNLPNEFRFKRNGEDEYRVFTQLERWPRSTEPSSGTSGTEPLREKSNAESSKEAQSEGEPKPKSGWYLASRRGIRDTIYIREEAGPGKDYNQAKVFVISNAPDNPGAQVWKRELEIAGEMASDAKIPLKDFQIFVQQDDGRYLLRTFREYQSRPLTVEGEKPEVIVQQNYLDRQGRLFSRQEVEKYLADAQRQPERPENNNGQVVDIDLSKHSLIIEPER